MKIRTLMTVAAGLGMSLAIAPHGVSAASKASVKVFMTGDCADGKMVEDSDEDDCQLTVSVTPKSKKVSATLEVAYDEEDPEWEELDSDRTRGGRVQFDVSATDEDDVWMDGVVLYRVAVSKSAGISVPKQKVYKVEYVSAENADESDLEMDEEDKAFNAEMDKAQADNKQKIQQQQPNQQVSSDKSAQNQDQKPGNFDKAAEFNRACGAIGFPKDKCDQLVATKAPNDALKILGNQAEKWCTALVNSKEQKVTCDMVLPKVFPPLNNG